MAQGKAPLISKSLRAPLDEESRQHVPNYEVDAEDEIGSAMERLILRQTYQEYVTRNKHGHQIARGTLCSVYRTPRGHIRVNVAAKYLINQPLTLSEAEGNQIIPFTFDGAWYFKGYENRERIDEIYKQRKSKYFRGCRAF